MSHLKEQVSRPDKSLGQDKRLRAEPPGPRVSVVRAVFETVRRGHGSTRREITARTCLTPSVVARAIRDLIDLGLLENSARGASTGGRAPSTLTVAGRERHVLALAFEASKVTVALADLTGRLVVQRTCVLADRHRPEEALALVETAYDSMLATHGRDSEALVAVGASLPAGIDPCHNNSIVACLMPEWIGFPLSEWLAARFGQLVYLANDVKAVALAELRAGRLRDSTCGVVVKLDTGVGSSITIGDELFWGAGGWSGDLGHVCVGDDADVRCRCGNQGCLEALVGLDSLLAEARRAATDCSSKYLHDRLLKQGQLGIDDIAACASAGDQVALRILHRAGERVGGVLSMVVNMLNPEVILLCGTVSSAGDFLLSGIRSEIFRHAHPFSTRNLTIECSSQADGAEVLGAAWHALDNHYACIGIVPAQQLLRARPVREAEGAFLPMRDSTHWHRPSESLVLASVD